MYLYFSAPGIDHGTEDLRHILAVPREGHLLAMRFVGDLLQRFAADEVVVELHERPVAQLIGRHVVVFDVRRTEAAGQSAGAFVARCRQPFAICLHLVARVDGRQRRRNPARFQRVRGISSGADRTRPNSLPASTNGLLHRVAFLIRPENFQTRSARHTVPQRADFPSPDLDLVHGEELDFRNRAAVQLLDHLLRVRSLNLVPIGDAVHGLAHRARGRAVVLHDLHVVPARLAHGTGSSWRTARVRRTPACSAPDGTGFRRRSREPS